MKEKIYCTHWGLLGEWWHVDADVTSEDEIAKIVHEHVMISTSASVEQVKQRLFGGFPCREGGTHIYHAAGHYTYLGENTDLDKNVRQEVWNNLLQGNADQFDRINRAAPFASDCPMVCPAPPEEGES